MDRHKLSLIGAVLAAVALVLGGWFIGVQPQLASASASDDQRSSIQSANEDNRAVLRKLEAEYRELGASKQALSDLQRSVPSTPDTAGFTRQVQAAVTASGTTLTSMTFGNVQPYAPVAASTSTTASGSAAAPTASASAAPAAVPSAVATPQAPQPYQNEQITSATFDLVPVTVAVDASDYAHALDFTRRMQHGDRLFLVDTLSQTAKESSGAAQSWSLTGYVYVVHSTSTATTGAGSTATSTATSTPANG